MTFRFDREVARELRESGLSYQQIGDQLGVTKTAVWFVLRHREDIDHPEIPGGRARRIDWDEVLRLRDEGQTLAQIAAAVGASKSGVARIIRLSTRGTDPA